MARFIHELAGWPAFTWNQDELADALAAVRFRQGHLLGRMEALGFQLRDEAALRNLTQDIVTSSEIEGEQLDVAQVRSSIARRLGLDVAGVVPSDRRVDGVVEMMLDATQRFAKPLTAERLFGWHAALFPTGRSGLRRIQVGAWRTDERGPMQVVSGPIDRERVHFEAPAADRLEFEMARFLDWFNGDTSSDPVLKAGVAHLWFVTIHPFEDGNGRIARAIGDQALARADGAPQRFYSLSAQIRRDRGRYYDLLEQTQRETLEITRWLSWFLAALDRALARAEDELEGVFARARFWEAIDDVSLNERQRRMLQRLLGGFEGKLTAAKWAQITKTSPDTALRDLNDLIEKGIIIRNPGGGRSVNYALAAPVDEETSA